jgi:hypothetical protein
MLPVNLTTTQLDIVQRPINAKLFLEGKAGTGKTTTAIERLLHLMDEGVPGDSILILVPQRTLGSPFYQTLQSPGVIAGGMVPILTIGGLAKRMIELFWPLIFEEAGFAEPNLNPTFLTLETAQYYMAHIVRPLLGEGYFDSVIIDRNRIYSQIIDNLNKAAVVGFPYTDIGERLKSSWTGESSQLRIYDQTQECAIQFRQYCLRHNLLDFSLQVEVFTNYLWSAPICQEYLTETYKHIIVENVEEDTPVTHDILLEWSQYLDSILIIYDHDAGFRRFLGADPNSAYRLKNACQESILFEKSWGTSPQITKLEINLGLALIPEGDRTHPEYQISDAIRDEESKNSPVNYEYHRFYPSMLDWVVENIARLIFDDGTQPNEIVVLAPFLSDTLRFSLVNRLENYNIPTHSLRPSRSLREEPATNSLLTLAALAHPTWDYSPNKFDVAYALINTIDGLDLVRGQLLTEIVYRTQNGKPYLSPFERINPETQARITYQAGMRYERLRQWLEEYTHNPQGVLDTFYSLLFGEVLSQPGFSFHVDHDSAEVTANLIESIQKFRWVTEDRFAEEGLDLGKEYFEMVREGVIAAQYLRGWQVENVDAVLLAPAYTFLMSNRAVDYQFWLDIGGRGWHERLYQPLTNPYVLSRNWPENTTWSDENEVKVGREILYRSATGLLRRCRECIYLGLSEYNEGGYEQRGPLLYAFQRLLRNLTQGNVYTVDQ